VLCLICIACTAKFTPACLVSKLLLRDKSWRFCTAVGVLMNSRGLVELIALNIGLTMVRSQIADLINSSNLGHTVVSIRLSV
jgi:Kef-type K+ transport system membrane component KefB